MYPDGSHQSDSYEQQLQALWMASANRLAIYIDNRFYRRVQPTWRRSGRSCPYEPRDISQEAWINLMKRRPQLPSNEINQANLFYFFRGHIDDAVKKFVRKSEKSGGGDDIHMVHIDSDLPSMQQTIRKFTESHESEHQLYINDFIGYLEKLDFECAEVVKLIIFGEKTNKDIAQKLGRSDVWVGTKRRKAETELSTYLSDNKET